MVLDQVENFIRVSVAGGHASGDNTISLQSGEASFLPDVNQGKYNLTWWDSENFSLPSEDPNVEIVRVNSIDTTNDTISVTRGQENTSATSKSTGDGEYSLILSPTAKTIEDIDANKLDASAYSPEADTHTRYSDSEAVSAVESVGDVSFSGGIRVNKSIHDRNINEDITLSSNEGLVVAGPITGSGSISGDGSFSVVGEPRNFKNADTLDGLDATDFVQSGSSIDADTLDGLDSTDFVQSGSSIDADTLDGLDSTDFVQTNSFSSHLTSTQFDAENGLSVNVFDSVDISNSLITKDSSNSISFNSSGVYEISWMVNFHRTGSGGRNIMYSEVEINGKRLTDRTRVADYIRTDGNGDECSTGSTVLLNISSGDTLQIYANEERGGESGNDIERAFINIKRV